MIAANGTERLEPGSGLDEALANLRSSDTEWRREDALYRAQRKTNALSPAEAEDYAAFVASLHRRKLEDCEAVRKTGGEKALEGFDCIKLKQAEALVASLPSTPAGAKTEFEKIDALEQRLKRLEAELDEELLRKQELYRKNARNQAGRAGAGSPAAGTTQAGSRLSGAGAAQQQQASKWPNPNEAGRKTPETGSSAEKGATTTSKNDIDGTDRRSGADRRRSANYDPGSAPGVEKKEKSPPAVRRNPEKGSDDDVVMRQIREAAERETDPVLKDKLWAEYRKLKAAR